MLMMEANSMSWSKEIIIKELISTVGRVMAVIIGWELINLFNLR